MSDTDNIHPTEPQLSRRAQKRLAAAAKAQAFRDAVSHLGERQFKHGKPFAFITKPKKEPLQPRE